MINALIKKEEIKNEILSKAVNYNSSNNFAF